MVDRYGSRTRYYIEIKEPEKYPGIEADLIGLLNARGLNESSPEPTRVLIQSFSVESLRRLRELDRRFVLIQLIGERPASETFAALDGIRIYASGIGPHKASIDRSLVEGAHSMGLVVHPYTVDDPAAMAAFLDMGVDGIFTNRPGLLREIISAR